LVPTLWLERGEIRITSGGEGGREFRIVRGGTLVRVWRGVIRAAVHPEGMRVWAERGEADIAVEGGQSAHLAKGEESLTAPHGLRRVAIAESKTDWTIRPDELRLASAAGASRLLKRQRAIEANEAAAQALEETTPPKAGQQKPSTTTSPELRRPTPPRPGGALPQAPAERGALPQPPAEPGAAPPSERTGAGQPAATTPRSTTESPAYQPIAVDQPITLVGGSGTFSLALGAVSSSTASGLSGGGASDAQQDSVNRSFPGNINLVSAQSKYLLSDVNLRPADRFSTTLDYWSIGLGKPPMAQVSTDFRTASAPIPRTLVIPGFNAYLVNLSEYGIPNLATNPVPITSALGISGLLGASPPAPRIENATPLVDGRAVFNDRATFALGEFASGAAGNHPFFDVRRSDQDRQIIKSSTGNDNLDIVRPNPFVTFTAVKDQKFFPVLPYVQVPSSSPIKPLPTYGGLDRLRRAAFTTLLANSLDLYSRRTGQTRFVVDHRIIDISGYRPKQRIDPLMLHASGVSPAANLTAGARRATRQGIHHP
jgi:hypothetical protein